MNDYKIRLHNTRIIAGLLFSGRVIEVFGKENKKEIRIVELSEIPPVCRQGRLCGAADSGIKQIKNTDIRRKNV